MIDHNPEELKRRVQLDSGNQLQHLKSLNDRARIDGSSVYLEALADRLLWNSSSNAVQDLAIEEVQRRLSDAFQFVWTKEYFCAGESHRIATFEHLATGLRLNLVPGGRYQRGTASNAAFYNEKSVSTVAIPALLVGQTQVTQQAWDVIGGEDHRYFNNVRLPMEGVSWVDCDNWLTKAADGLRLLSEAEWEYACRAGTMTDFCFGNDQSILAEHCWFNRNSDGKTHFVGEKQPNAFGLHDMHGNLYEWCADWYVDNYKDVPNNHVPYDTPTSNRVLRGGSWSDDARSCRSTYRYGSAPLYHDLYVGFRVARSID